MSDRRSDIQVGLFAIIAVLLLAMMILIFGGFRNFLSDTYIVTARFPTAAGTAEGTPVRLLGIEVGRVSGVGLAPDNGGVEMKLDIHKDVSIRSDAAIAIKQEGFIANIYIEFGVGSGNTFLPKDGSAVINGDIQTFAAYFERAAQSLSQAGNSINSRVGDIAERFGKLADSLNNITSDPGFQANLKTTFDNASVVTGQLRESLPALMGNMNAAAAKAQTTIDRASVLMETYQKLGTDLDGQVARQGANMDDVTQSLTAAADSISVLAGSLNEVALAVKGGQGTIGKLFTDDELYRSFVVLIDMLSKASGEFGDLAETLKRHPDWIIKGPPKERQ